MKGRMRIISIIFVLSVMPVVFSCSEGESTETVEIPTSEPKEYSDDTGDDTDGGSTMSCAQMTPDEWKTIDIDGNGVPDIFEDDVNQDWIAGQVSRNDNADHPTGIIRGDFRNAGKQKTLSASVYPATILPPLILVWVFAWVLKKRAR